MTFFLANCGRYVGYNVWVSTSMVVEIVSPSNGMACMMSLGDESLRSCEIPQEVVVGSFSYFFGCRGSSTRVTPLFPSYRHTYIHINIA